MAEEKKQKVVHVDNLVIHAQNIEIVNHQQENRRRDLWEFLWGLRPVEESVDPPENDH